jgi:hypothetical protein
MGRGPALLTLGLLALALFPAAPGAAEGHEVEWARFPAIDVGDHWEFEIEGRENGFITNDVKARESKTNHFGVQVDALRVRSEGIVTSEQSPAPGRSASAFPLAQTEHHIVADKWVRADDHAVVETHGTVTIQGVLESEILESFRPPLVHALYPFAVGYEWVAEATWHLERGAETQGDQEVELSAKVLAYEAVTVPAGRFTAWKVEYQSFRTSAWRVVQWWSQDACGIVKEEQYDRDQRLVNTLRLTSWSCSGDHGDEPSYQGRNIYLRSTGGNPMPPWLKEAPPTEEERPPRPDAVRGGLLRDGRMLWVALAMTAVASVLFIIVGRRRD